MEDKLIDVFNRNVYDYPMHLELYYSKSADWYCKIWRIGCADDGSDLIVSKVQGRDKDYVIAKAYVNLCDYLSKENGGY